MEGCIVEEWLRSLGLIHHTQAFLDNGYDDLEVCKQIGCPDLDAIGVDDPAERTNVLAAVKLLLEEGGTRVYFTLEPDYPSPSGDAVAPGVGGQCTAAPGGGSGASAAPSSSNGVPPTPHSTSAGGGGRCFSQVDNQVDSIEDYDEAEEYSGAARGVGAGGGRDLYDVGRAALVTFPRIQLAAIVRDRAEEDGIDLAQLYQPGHQIEPGGALDELTKRYSAELKTHYHHVLEALRFQAEMAATQFDTDNYSNDTDDVGFSMFSVAGHSHRSVPPPLPSCPPPSTSFADGSVLEGSKVSPHHTNRSPVHADPNCHANEELSELGDCDGTLKKRSGIGRFFKNMGVRRSGRKYVYKQHEGDLHASEITMPDEERIELMLLVKEGKLSMHDAVETVKHYENWKRRQLALELGASAGQHSPLLDVSPAPPHPHGNQHYLRSSAKVKKVTFSIPLFKLPTMRRKSLLTKQKSLSSADSPVKGRQYALSGSDYCEPPVEISPDEEGLPGFPPLRVDLRARHKKSGDICDPGHVATYSPSQWISPMLLRRYIKSGDSGKGGEQGPPVREQRRGLFSSPFIKRKGSLDSKVAGRGGAGSLRTSGSFGASEADGGRVRGHRGILHSSSLAFGSRESLREQLKTTRSAMSTFGEPLSSARSASRETITVATVHATDCPEDDPMEPSAQEEDGTTTTTSGTSSPCRRSPPNGPGVNHQNHQGRPPGGQTMNENNRNLNGHHHHQQQQQQQQQHHNQCNKLTHSSPGGNSDTGLRKPTPNNCDSNSTLRIESCVVCNKNEENLKSELSGDSTTARDSPDIGIEDTSPTGTLDSTASEDFKDSKYGSSSTMSVGSDVSPVTERRGGKKAIIKPSKLQQHHTNSAGEECMSSDYEDGDDLAVKTSNARGGSSLLKDVCGHHHKEALTPGGGSPRHLPSSPSTMSETSHDADSIIYSPRRQRLGRKSSKRPRPKTVEELLGRLGIQHLLSVFLVHGYQSLELFSELEEEDLDELSITQPEDRAKILTAAQLLLDYEGSSQDQSAFPADSNSLASSQSQSGISSCDSQHDSLLANAVPATAHAQKAPPGVDSGSSSDELNLQHATISDQESTSGGDADEGTLKAAPPPPPGGRHTSNSDSDNNLVAAKNQQNSTTTSSSPHSKSAPSSGVNGTSVTSTTTMGSLQTPTMTISTISTSVLPSQDVTKVKLRTSTGTCTSPHLGRRSLTDSSDGDGSGKKSQSSDSAVSSDMDSSSSSPLRRRAAETSDEALATSPSSRGDKQQQRASTGSGPLVKPPKPKVPVRTVSLPGPTTTGGAGTGNALGSFRSAQEVTTDSSKPAAAPRLGKMSSVRDKV